MTSGLGWREMAGRDKKGLSGNRCDFDELKEVMSTSLKSGGTRNGKRRERRLRRSFFLGLD